MPAEPNPPIISRVRAKYLFIGIKAPPSHCPLIDFANFKIDGFVKSNFFRPAKGLFED